MAITKNDCLLLLSDLSDKGINTDKYIRNLYSDQSNLLDVIKFINDNRQLDLTKFFEKIRKSYNQKHSSLYINIMRSDERNVDVLTTLSALSTQILLFLKTAEDRNMFLKHSRFDEIHSCLYTYSQTYDLVPCMKLLNLIKADIKVLESMNK